MQCACVCEAVLTVFVVDDLEVLNGGLSDTSVEVKNMRSRLLVPYGCLVVELDHVVHVSVLVSDE